jgi:hypothetical protein
MPIKPLLPDETVGSLEDASEARYWEAMELFLRSQYFGAIYLLGYVAEIRLKTAVFRWDSAGASSLAGPRMRPIRVFARAAGISTSPDGLHSLPWWAEILIRKRGNTSRPLDPKISGELMARASRLYSSWGVAMRYHAGGKETLAGIEAEKESSSVLADVDWIICNYTRLWS